PRGGRAAPCWSSANRRRTPPARFVRSLLGLGRGFGGLGLFLALVPVVLLLELLDAAGGVHELPLAGEERVARRADFDVDDLARAARRELVAAAAGDGRFLVLGVDVGFHGWGPYRGSVCYPLTIYGAGGRVKGSSGSYAGEPEAQSKGEPGIL